MWLINSNALNCIIRWLIHVPPSLSLNMPSNKWPMKAWNQ